MSGPMWTPGPWFSVNCGTNDEPMYSVKAARIAGKPPRHEVAICATGDSPQAMETANSRLIAAAPDLFEALKDAEGHLEEMRRDMKWHPIAHCPVLDKVRAALAKAKGET